MGKTQSAATLAYLTTPWAIQQCKGVFHISWPLNKGIVMGFEAEGNTLKFYTSTPVSTTYQERQYSSAAVPPPSGLAETEQPPGSKALCVHAAPPSSLQKPPVSFHYAFIITVDSLCVLVSHSEIPALGLIDHLNYCFFVSLASAFIFIILAHLFYWGLFWFGWVPHCCCSVVWGFRGKLRSTSKDRPTF